jgi:chitinase
LSSYDVWGSWSSTVGPNAPLNDTCAPDAAQQGSAVSAVAAWHAAGIPLHQIVLGVPAYGHSFSVAPADALRKGKLAVFPKFNASVAPAGDKWDDAAGTDECGNYASQGGLWDYWGLIDAGWITRKGTAAKGIHYVYDKCSQTVSPSFISRTTGSEKTDD